MDRGCTRQIDQQLEYGAFLAEEPRTEDPAIDPSKRHIAEPNVREQRDRAEVREKHGKGWIEWTAGSVEAWKHGRPRKVTVGLGGQWSNRLPGDQ